MNNYPKYSYKNYRTIKLLGKGSFGNVYLVKNTINHSYYAMKILNCPDKKTYLEILNEITIHKKLNCKYIIKIYEYYYHKKSMKIIMEYAEKGDLEQFIKRYKKLNKKISDKGILKILTQISTGIEHLHNENIIHRDLKPSNILIDKNYNFKIADFGVSKVINNRYKLAYTCVGTPYYMAPEVIANSKMGYSFSSDLWSLGCILFQLLTFNYPFYGRNMIDLSNNIKRRKPSYYQIRFPKYKNLIRNLLKKNPYSRANMDYIKDFLYFENRKYHVDSNLEFKKFPKNKNNDRYYSTPNLPKLNNKRPKSSPKFSNLKLQNLNRPKSSPKFSNLKLPKVKSIFNQKDPKMKFKKKWH